MFYACDDIIQKLNDAGRRKTPFLFGVDFEMSEGFFVPQPLRQTDILFDFNGVTNFSETVGNVPRFRFNSFPEAAEVYENRFRHVMHGLRRGDSYLANLTVKTPIETSLPLREIFAHSRAMYRLYVPDRFVCFSPECFVKIESGKIFSHPMKGTIDAALPRAAETLLADFKETAEHSTIVDLIRNDLSRIATRVRVNRFRYIDTLATHKGDILQASSEIEGTLPHDYLSRIGTLFFELLPAGSVSGAPKDATLRIIREAEGEPRGFYTGVAGYFDGERLDACVLIRYIEQNNDRLFFRSGGGITAHSTCESEYREVIQKVYLPFTPSL